MYTDGHDAYLQTLRTQSEASSSNSLKTEDEINSFQLCKYLTNVIRFHYANREDNSYFANFNNSKATSSTKKARLNPTQFPDETTLIPKTSLQTIFNNIKLLCPALYGVYQHSKVGLELKSMTFGQNLFRTNPNKLTGSALATESNNPSQSLNHYGY